MDKMNTKHGTVFAKKGWNQLQPSMITSMPSAGILLLVSSKIGQRKSRYLGKAPLISLLASCGGTLPELSEITGAELEYSAPTTAESAT